MAKGNQQPKSDAKVKRNADRRNGKAYGKNSGPTFTTPGVSPRNSKGGKFGYSHKRLVKMAAQQGVSFVTLVEDLANKLSDRADRAACKPKTSAARPGIGDCTYKMTSVDRHFDKRRPYPSVPKGLKHAGKPEKKTDRRENTKAEEMALAAA